MFKEKKINCKTFDSPAKRRLKRIVPVLPTESNKILRRHLNWKIDVPVKKYALP